jgi:hypothetical protein
MNCPYHGCRGDWQGRISVSDFIWRQLIHPATQVNRRGAPRGYRRVPLVGNVGVPLVGTVGVPLVGNVGVPLVGTQGLKN